MLNDDQKKAIQQAYSTFLANKQLRARDGQKSMIAEVARLLGGIEQDAEGHRSSDPAVLAVEAGTGTGKTVGYVIPAVVMAQALNKRLVIATATVALQEQVINKDLPDIIEQSGLEFSYTLAKGRGRYACLLKLERLLDKEYEQNALFEGYDAPASSSEEIDPLYLSMFEAVNGNQWAGDRDSWPETLPDEQWQPLTSDRGQCTSRRCAYYKNCPFYLGRDQLAESDVIVANHDLVLADLSLGGGVILPDQEETIYIFDEGHHLPDKAISHFTAQTRIKGTVTWLDRHVKQLKKLLKQNALQGDISAKLEQLDEPLHTLSTRLSESYSLLTSLATFDPTPSFTAQGEGLVAYHRFAGGVVPEALLAASNDIKVLFSHCMQRLEGLLKLAGDELDDPQNDAFKKAFAEKMLQAFSEINTRMEGHYALWQAFTEVDKEGDAPHARWLKWSETPSGGEDIELFSSPIMASEMLRENLWYKSFAVILTSATLAALGSFDRLRMRTGIPTDSKCVIVPSPFHHQSAASLVIPNLGVSPKDTAAHTQAVAEALPEIFTAEAKGKGILVLFSSRKQMRDVYFAQAPEWRSHILLQDDHSRQALLKKHREAIDVGESSILFGLASLAEGIDLPRDYCTHVIIAKIPFSVPDDPVEASLSEWLELQGRNPFMEITVPDATIRLIQACGRLLRTEQDSGLVTIMDRRLVETRYGGMILNSLPPFKREVQY